MSQWIKCSGRMPEEGKPVLVVSSIGGAVQNNVYEWDGRTWCDFRADYNELSMDVFTHWMPLPEPPQE